MTNREIAEQCVKCDDAACRPGNTRIAIVAALDAKDQLYAAAWAECQAWRWDHEANPKGRSYGPIAKARQANDAARKEAGL